MMTCTRCLQGRHVRCSRDHCACNICKVTVARVRPPQVNRKPGAQRTAKPRIRTDRVNAPQLRHNPELWTVVEIRRQQGWTWRQIGAELDRDYSGLARSYKTYKERQAA